MIINMIVDYYVRESMIVHDDSTIFLIDVFIILGI